MELGFTREHAVELAREIDLGAVLDQIHTHRHVKSFLASMHTGSWFKVNGSEEVLVVGKGGR